MTFDAKSTSKDRISAGTTKLSALKRHQSAYNATYAIEVAIAYAGEDDPDSAVSTEANQQKVTLIKVKDLARLLLNAAPKQLGLAKLQNLFETCYTPKDVSTWIDNLEAENPKQGPYYDIIDIVYNFQKDDNEPPTLSVIRLRVNEKTNGDYSTAQIKTFIEAIQSIIPGHIHLDGNIVSIESSPTVIRGYISKAINTDIPVTMQDIYNSMFSV